MREHTAWKMKKKTKKKSKQKSLVRAQSQSQNAMQELTLETPNSNIRNRDTQIQEESYEIPRQGSMFENIKSKNAKIVSQTVSYLRHLFRVGLTIGDIVTDIWSVVDLMQSHHEDVFEAGAVTLAILLLPNLLVIVSRGRLKDIHLLITYPIMTICYGLLSLRNNDKADTFREEFYKLKRFEVLGESGIQAAANVFVIQVLPEVKVINILSLIFSLVSSYYGLYDLWHEQCFTNERFLGKAFMLVYASDLIYFVVTAGQILTVIGDMTSGSNAFSIVFFILIHVYMWTKISFQESSRRVIGMFPSVTVVLDPPPNILCVIVKHLKGKICNMKEMVMIAIEIAKFSGLMGCVTINCALLYTQTVSCVELPMHEQTALSVLLVHRTFYYVFFWLFIFKPAWFFNTSEKSEEEAMRIKSEDIRSDNQTQKPHQDQSEENEDRNKGKEGKTCNDYEENQAVKKEFHRRTGRQGDVTTVTINASEQGQGDDLTHTITVHANEQEQGNDFTNSVTVHANDQEQGDDLTNTIIVHANEQEQGDDLTKIITVHANKQEQGDDSTNTIIVQANEKEQGDKLTKTITVHVDEQEQGDDSTNTITVHANEQEQGDKLTNTIRVHANEQEQEDDLTNTITVHTNEQEQGDDLTNTITVHGNEQEQGDDLTNTIMVQTKVQE